MKPSNRVLYNADCNACFYDPRRWQPDGGPYSASAVHRFVDLVAGSGVDTLLVNPNVQRVWYPSKVVPAAWDGYTRGDRDFFRGHADAVGVKPERLDAYLDMLVGFMNSYIDLLDAGVDWVAEAALRCRQRGISPWVSVRMNDMHGAKNPSGSFMNAPIFADDGNRLHKMGIPGEDHINWYRSGLNFALQPVRDYMLAIIRELVQDYDYEGLELDWWRNAICCDPEASDETIEIMLDWLAEIRSLTDARSRLTGRPYYLGLRIPADLRLVRTIGLNVPEMSRRKLIDFVGPSNFWQTTWDVPHDELKRQLGDEVAVYGVIEDAPNWHNGYSPVYNRSGIRYLTASAELLRGNAAGKLALGADGIELFNFFCTDPSPHTTDAIPGMVCNYPAIHGIADLAGLRGQTKHYAFATTRIDTSERYFELMAALPDVVEAKCRRTFRLPMCAEPAGRGLNVVIQVIMDQTPAPPSIGVSFNGSWMRFDAQSTRNAVFPVGPYTEIPTGSQALNFTFPVQRICEGWNTITVYNNNEPDSSRADPLANSVRFTSIELAIM